MNLNKNKYDTKNININELFLEQIKEKENNNYYFIDDYITKKEITDSYFINKGYYFEQINYILTKFNRNQIHISISEEILENPIEEYNKIFKFLGTKEINKKKSEYKTDFYKTSYIDSISNENFKYLYNLYKPHNEKLYNLLGRTIHKWESKYNKK